MVARRADSRRHDQQPGRGRHALRVGGDRHPRQPRSARCSCCTTAWHYNNGVGRGGSFTAIATNDATVQEISLETGGLSAESEVERHPQQRDSEGRRQPVQRVLLRHVHERRACRATNLTDELKARGLTSVDRVNYIYDIDPALGGPITKDTALVLRVGPGLEDRSVHRPGSSTTRPHGAARHTRRI